MGSCAGSGNGGGECARCAGRDAAIAQLKGDKEDAERRAAEASCALAPERNGREDAEARRPEAIDRQSSLIRRTHPCAAATGRCAPSTMTS